LRPVLLELGPLKIHAYGLALAVSFLVGSWWVTRRGRRLGYLEDDLLRLFWWILASALIGSRLYYALQHPQDFSDNWIEVTQIWRGGLTQYGGLIGAVIVGGLFIRSRGWSFRQISDLVTPALAFGEAFTRIGCFFNGCCFGSACSLPWAVTFREGSHAHYVLGSTPVHPSQLYLSIGNGLLLLALLRLERRVRRPGGLFAIYLGASSIIRFVVDFTRYYEPGDVFGIGGVAWAHSQWLSLAFVGIAVLIWVTARIRD